MEDLKQLLEKIHIKGAQLLLARIESGEATSADMANAIKLLAHNNIQCLPGAGEGGRLIDRLKEKMNLPFTSATSPNAQSV